MYSAMLRPRLIAAYLVVLVVAAGCVKKVYLPVKTEVEWTSTVYVLQIENGTGDTFWLVPTEDAAEVGVSDLTVPAGAKTEAVQIQVRRFKIEDDYTDNQVIPGAYINAFGANTAVIMIRTTSDPEEAPEEVKIDLSDHPDAGWYDEQSAADDAVVPMIFLKLENFDHLGNWYKEGDRLVASRSS